jgi:thioredoxin reductase (NADPH)
MPEPVIVVVVDEAEPRRTLQHNLTRRYGADYEVQCVAKPEDALRHLAELRRTLVEVPIVIADLRLPDMDGLTFLTKAREELPAAKRVLLIDHDDAAAGDKIVEGMAFGLFDRVLTKQGFPAEEWLYPTVAEFLADWSRGTARPRFEAARVIGKQGTRRSYELRDLFTRSSIPFGFYDAASDEGRRQLAAASVSDERLPVVISYGGQVLCDPTNEQVAAMLGVSTEPDSPACDLVIIGGGPAGLSAAVYGASEGLQTTVIEHEAMGGQAGTSSMIRNYLGFHEGISGARLAQSAMMQARFFGAGWVYDAAVDLAADGQDRILTLDNGGLVRCRSVVIATGVSYRRLEIPALEALVGTGVFYGTGSSEARSLRGQAVYVVGAGNSAGQAATFLAAHADQVTILCRGASLAETMSDYLIRQITATDNIAVRTATEVVDGGGSGRLEWITLQDNQTGARERHPAAALFVLIGAKPCTEWLAGTVQRDPGGYILTGRDVVLEPESGPSWPLDRPPGIVETSLPGVFAVGDVRHGATKRVATAVGEGALAIHFVHEYLAEPSAQTAPR